MSGTFVPEAPQAIEVEDKSTNADKSGGGVKVEILSRHANQAASTFHNKMSSKKTMTQFDLAVLESQEFESIGKLPIQLKG